MKPTSLILLPWLVAPVLLTGCAEMRVRDLAQQQLASGQLDEAIGTLETGVRAHPESTPLRAKLIQARAEAIARKITTVAALRAAGKLEDAERELKSALLLDPRNRRLESLVDEIAAERRQQAALTEAEQWLAKKRADMALRTVEAALKDNPRHAGLQALQRRIEAEQRQSQLRSAQTVLAETRPISLDFRDAGLRTVLDVVSRNSGINFILDRDIRPDTRVTVLLRQARVEDALDLIIGTNQLAKKVVDPRTIVVYPNTPEKQREYQEQVVRVFHLASAEAKGAAAFLRSTLRIREPFVDERSNMLALRDSAENIQLAERLIALYDAGEPEVLLDVEVLEISSTRLTELGIKYPDSFSMSILLPADTPNLTLGNIRDLTRDNVGVGIGGLLVNLKRQVGDFSTLANPRIRARNKEKARILIGDKIPVVTTTSSGAGGFVSESVNYLDVGIKLDVEPTVYADDEVAIRIALEVSALGTSTRTAGGSTVYQIGTRNASTLLRLRDGETQLLGGLISREERSSSSRVPGIGDLPVLGRLFSSQADNAARTELVLAITPQILRNIRRPSASESELWVGTEALPRLSPVGGVRGGSDADPPSPKGAPQPAIAPAVVLPPPAASPASAPAASPPAPAAKLSWSGPFEARVGQLFEMKLILSSSEPLRGMPVELAFTADKLELVDIQEGEFFRQGNMVTNFTKSGEAKTGRVTVGVLRSETSGASGDGTVLTLRFKAMAAGATNVAVLSAKPQAATGPAPTLVMPAAQLVQVK